MNFHIIFYIIGYILRIEGLLLLLPAFTGMIYREQEAIAYLICAVATALVGALMTVKKPKNQVFYAKEGFTSVALCWIFLSLFGCAPFILSGDIPRFADAFFEMVSGFTTTGSSILTDVEAMSHATLFWRSFSHWIGGMGILVFALSILPLTGGSTMHLMKAESPGPQVGKMLPKIKDTSKILYIIYTVMTLAEILILICTKMPIFDAITISLGTAGTGGFAVRASGCADYTAAQQYIIAIFMILFGINFNVYFLAVRRQFKQAFRCEEARWYLGIIGASTLMIMLNTLKIFATAEEAFRHALFQVGSIITTTGYATFDFSQFYPVFSNVVLILLMFIGACAGSTGGGMKVSRIVIWAKSALHEITQTIHPRAVRKVRLEGKVVDSATMRSIHGYFAAYFFVFSGALLLICLDNFDFTSNFTAVVTTINNIGPGLNVVGPYGSFAEYSDLSKFVFSLTMLTGRLELFPMLALFYPQTWTRSFKLK